MKSGFSSPCRNLGPASSTRPRGRRGRRLALRRTPRGARRPVSCEPTGTDQYGRTLAICFEAGEDLNALMVRDGQAVAYRYFSTRYVSQEDDAKAASRGLWATVF